MVESDLGFAEAVAATGDSLWYVSKLEGRWLGCESFRVSVSIAVGIAKSACDDVRDYIFWITSAILRANESVNIGTLTLVPVVFPNS